MVLSYEDLEGHSYSKVVNLNFSDFDGVEILNGSIDPTYSIFQEVERIRRIFEPVFKNGSKRIRVDTYSSSDREEAMAARDLPATKTFFSAVFGWEFVDYGPEYSAFSNQGLDGGFYKADMCSQTSKGAALLVFYSADIQSTTQKVINNGGTIIKPLFDFPGGCRFHFTEPSGNEFAVWSEV